MLCYRPIQYVNVELLCRGHSRAGACQSGIHSDETWARGRNAVRQEGGRWRPRQGETSRRRRAKIDRRTGIFWRLILMPSSRSRPVVLALRSHHAGRWSVDLVRGARPILLLVPPPTGDRSFRDFTGNDLLGLHILEIAFPLSGARGDVVIDVTRHIDCAFIL